jgi:N-methylhydantoinase A/oxoprolinase/acetone carboxylase beta subunit
VTPQVTDTRTRVGVGIDTGGTFTDAVAVELGSGTLLSKAKAPTTRQDLSTGVREALLALDTALFPRVELVALSTTLATNAVVEGKGSRVGLIIAVPDPATFELPVGLPAAEVAVIAGAHSPAGEVRTALDEGAARAAIASMAPSVEAFAVSSYFSVSNSGFELTLKALVSQAGDAPIVCGHELSQRIGMVERATTAALNARLLPLVRELLDAVRGTHDACGIRAPLMVVKGDGSLTAERVALVRPVETVLSGPAASVIGACRLSGLSRALVADMGGTTTDVALVANGMPEVNPAGALVGGWRTRVQALDVATVGLGGDSRIRITADGAIDVGPDRVIPLSVAAMRFPELVGELERLASVPRGKADPLPEPLFLTLTRRSARALSASVMAVFDALDGRAMLAREAAATAGPFVDLDALVRSGHGAEIAFTPTDALVAAGELALGQTRAASLGLGLLAEAARRSASGLLEDVRAAVTRRIALAVAARALAEDVPERDPSAGDLATLSHLLVEGDACLLRARFEIGVPLVAVGAPAAAWFPAASALLGADLVVPLHAEVANAYGALAGRVIERGEARVRAEPDETFVVITPDIRERFDDYAPARTRAEELAAGAARTAAMEAGAPSVTVTLSHDEVVARHARASDDVLVELTVIATASGPPYLAAASPEPTREERS